MVDQYLSLLEPLGIAPGPVEFHVPIPAAADRRMEDFLCEQGVKSHDCLRWAARLASWRCSSTSRLCW